MASSPPRRHLCKEGGEPLLPPLSPCAIYDISGNTVGSGRYALFIYNHDGHYKNYGPADTRCHRWPVDLVSGRYQAGADQPVWFAEPKFFMDHEAQLGYFLTFTWKPAVCRARISSVAS